MVRLGIFLGGREGGGGRRGIAILQASADTEPQHRQVNHTKTCAWDLQSSRILREEAANVAQAWLWLPILPQLSPHGSRFMLCL